jgi:hypothetical protein
LGGKNGILLFFFNTISSMSRNQKLPKHCDQTSEAILFSLPPTPLLMFENTYRKIGN